MKQPSDKQNEQTTNDLLSDLGASYEELIQRSEKLEEQLQSLISAGNSETHKIMLIKGSLKGAKELLFRQDETSEDFTIGIVVLLQQASMRL